MAQQPIEMILLRQWATYVAVPIWITDPGGNLVYYNEPAEPILGRRFDEAGEIPAGRLAEHFVTSNPDGSPMPSEEVPLVVALTRRVPSHRLVRISALDGSERVIEVMAIPLVGQAGRHLGAMAFFWEPGD